jgi:hypothetical protein
MRRRLFSIIGALAVVSLLAAPVSAAAPIDNGWDSFEGTVPDSCTGEVVDDHGRVHNLLTDGFSHFNVHLEAIGESSGVAYVGNDSLNAPVHVAPDGTSTVDQHFRVTLISKGASTNAVLTIRIQQVFDASGNLISETVNVSQFCRGS